MTQLVPFQNPWSSSYVPLFCSRHFPILSYTMYVQNIVPLRRAYTPIFSHMYIYIYPLNMNQYMFRWLFPTCSHEIHIVFHEYQPWLTPIFPTHFPMRIFQKAPRLRRAVHGAPVCRAPSCWDDPTRSPRPTGYPRPSTMSRRRRAGLLGDSDGVSDGFYYINIHGWFFLYRIL